MSNPTAAHRCVAFDVLPNGVNLDCSCGDWGGGTTDAVAAVNAYTAHVADALLKQVEALSGEWWARNEETKTGVCADALDALVERNRT